MNFDNLSYAPLSIEDEKALFASYHATQDPKAKEKLIKHNLRLVYKVAKRYSFKFKSTGFFNDLFQEGVLGLIRAVEKFDYSKGMKFGSYAYLWIKAFVMRLLNTDGTVNMYKDRNNRKIILSISKLSREYAHLEHEDFLKKAAEILQVSANEIEQVLMNQTVSLDSQAKENNLGVDQSDFPERLLRQSLMKEGAACREPIVLVQHKELVEKTNHLINIFLSRLNGRHGLIFSRRLLQEEPDTLQSIGNDLGLTRERVRQIESSLLKKFSGFLASQNITECYF